MKQLAAGSELKLRSYLTGFVLALILTAIPFGIIAVGALTRSQTLVIIALAAIAQVLLQLRYFLHLDLSTTPRENLLALVFTAVLIFIMLGGSFWIMFDLHHRMMN